MSSTGVDNMSYRLCSTLASDTEVSLEEKIKSNRIDKCLTPRTKTSFQEKVKSERSGSRRNKEVYDEFEFNTDIRDAVEEVKENVTSRDPPSEEMTHYADKMHNS